MFALVAGKKAYTLGFRITDEMKAELQKLASAKTRTIGQQAEHLLKMALDLQRATKEEEADRVREAIAKYGKEKK